MSKTDPVFSFEELVRMNVALAKDIETMQRLAHEDDTRLDQFWAVRIEAAQSAEIKVHQMLKSHRAPFRSGNG
jgi:hypothetical protein